MRQIKKNYITKTKLITLIAIISMTTGCATNSRHRKIALKIVKNNNVILKEIKKERSQNDISPKLKNSPELMKAERRLMSALNAVIKSNEELKTEFSPKRHSKINPVHQRGFVNDRR